MYLIFTLGLACVSNDPNEIFVEEETLKPVAEESRAIRARSTQVFHPSESSGVQPLLQTSWGQAGDWQQNTPFKDGEATYPGCTTIASAQVLYYYQYKNHASSDVCYSLEHSLNSTDIEDDVLCINFESDDIRYNWDSMALSDEESATAITAAADFIYHVGVTLNAQFGGGEGSSATARQIENAFRYQWGFLKRREDEQRSKSVKVILKDEFFDSDEDFADHLRMELNAGRPVLYMAQMVQGDAGHAFVIDGYNSSGLFHVNWGWGGYGNGYYDLSMTDPSNRSWSRNALIYQYLEPLQDFALSRIETETPRLPYYSWNGNGSLISYASEDKTGYGLTIDEAAIHPSSLNNPIVFFQWEIDNQDGTHVRIDVASDSIERATITYGPWNDRSQDISYQNVPLPFVIDPAQDGFSTQDQQYYVIAVSFAEKPTETTSVIAELTTESSTQSSSVPATPFIVDGFSWQGNGSLISYASGSLKGYGLDLDEGLVSANSEDNGIVFFQWEIDSQDGTTLQLSAEGLSANITYGPWNDRTADVTHSNVDFPFTIDPAADGLPNTDGEYYVVKIEFINKPTNNTSVEAIIIK